MKSALSGNCIEVVKKDDRHSVANVLQVFDSHLFNEMNIPHITFMCNKSYMGNKIRIDAVVFLFLRYFPFVSKSFNYKVFANVMSASANFSQVNASFSLRILETNDSRSV